MIPSTYKVQHFSIVHRSSYSPRRKVDSTQVLKLKPAIYIYRQKSCIKLTYKSKFILCRTFDVNFIYHWQRHFLSFRAWTTGNASPVSGVATAPNFLSLWASPSPDYRWLLRFWDITLKGAVTFRVIVEDRGGEHAPRSCADGWIGLT